MTGANAAEGATPIRCVGESGVTSSGNAALDALELAHERVVRRVGDLGRVERVVAVRVVLDLRAKRGGARGSRRCVAGVRAGLASRLVFRSRWTCTSFTE